ncbi:STAS domain-containing protein [Agrobacterium sp. ES01]|uniref:STAS domain-containing protein n=1 Tax=Agrobacterium sp. ES01 TaxID=3420714 RepID=UPI003D11B565
MAPKKSAQGSLKLSAVLDLNEASTLRESLLSLRGKPLAIDASEVERVSTPCVQVLMAGAKAWEEDKKSYSFASVSETFTKTLQLIGVNIDHLLAKEIQQ